MTADAAVPAAKAAKQAAHAAKNVATAAEIVGDDAIELVLTPVKAFNTRQAIMVAGVTVGVIVAVDRFNKERLKRAAKKAIHDADEVVNGPTSTRVNGSE